MIRLVSQAHLCSSSEKVTNNDEDIEPSFAPLELMTSSLALLSNVIQRRKIRLIARDRVGLAFCNRPKPKLLLLEG